MFQTLLVPLDGSGFGEDTLPYAVRIARETNAEVAVVHVHVPHPPGYLMADTRSQFERVDVAEYDRRERSREEAYLTSVARRIRESGCEARPVVLSGMVAKALDDYTRRTGPGLIVMTTHGRSGLSRAWLGSVADAVVRHVAWPVLLIRPREPGGGESDEGPEGPVEMKRILVPLDGSTRSERIVPPVLTLAGALGSAVRLLQVVTPNAVLGTRVFPVPLAAVNEARRRAAAYLEGVAGRFRAEELAVDTEVLDDPQPALAILEVVEREQVHLVAMATHGYRGVKRAVLGSVADKVLRGAEVPLLLLGPGVEALH